MRAVLDPNVLISAALSPNGPPGRAFRHWLDGTYDLIVSPLLLEELRRALAYPKLRDRIPPDDADALVGLLTHVGVLRDDPEHSASVSSTDPDDNYLIELAHDAAAVLVSGDGDLLKLNDQLPIYSPVAFLNLIDATVH